MGDNEANVPGVAELQKIKKNIEKKHPHMKTASGEVNIDPTTTVGHMHKNPDRPVKIFPDEAILRPKASIFEPDPVAMKLPSGSLVVDPKFLSSNNEVYVRRMTAIEENMILKLAGVSEVSVINQSIDSIIQSCLKTNIDPNSLLLIDKFALFLKIISITYGKISTTLTCPSCDTVYENYEIDVYGDFPVQYVPEGFEYPYPIKIESYDACDLTWYVTYPTIGDTKTMLQDPNIDEMAQLYVTKTIEGWIQLPDGSKRDVQQSDWKPLIINLNKEDKKKYKKFMDEFSQYGIAMSSYLPFCTNTKCQLFATEQKIDVPVEDIFSMIITQYTKADKG